MMSKFRRSNRSQVPSEILSSYLTEKRGGARPGAGRPPGRLGRDLQPEKVRPQHHLCRPRKRPRGKLSEVELQEHATDARYRELLEGQQKIRELEQKLTDSVVGLAAFVTVTNQERPLLGKESLPVLADID